MYDITHVHVHEFNWALEQHHKRVLNVYSQQKAAGPINTIKLLLVSQGHVHIWLWSDAVYMYVRIGVWYEYR